MEITVNGGADRLRLVRDGEVWVWVDEAGTDTGVQGRTPSLALMAAYHAWDGWDMAVTTEDAL